MRKRLILPIFMLSLMLSLFIFISAPRPAEDADAFWQPHQETPPVASFIDSIKGNDTALEIFVGQGRILTTKGDIADEDHGARGGNRDTVRR